MRHFLAVTVMCFALNPIASIAQTAPDTGCAPDANCAPSVVLKDAPLPVGEATNFIFIAPAIAGLLGVVAASGGGGSNSTPSTVTP